MRRTIAPLILLMSMTCLGLGQSKEEIAFPLIGKIQPRHALEIASSNWAIGAETMDRDLVEYDSWKDHIGPLGAKKVRLQAGWARCEREKGVYDFEWLDEVIDGVRAQGVEPWLQTSYGNPIYEGGGGIHLSAGIPSSEAALTAWDNWVRTMAERYKGRVHIWEVWNEPDNKGKTSPEDYAALYIRTAEIIRSIDPDATLYALSLASTGDKGRRYADTFLRILKEQGKLDLVDELTLHGYTYNPSDVYPRYKSFRAMVKQHSDRITLRQGELGCPSENQTIYALKNYEWTELSQAKWVLRKLMGDLGRDLPSSYFLIIDIVYTHDHEVLMDTPKRNTKGLIKSDLDKNFVALKQSYHACQHVTSIFDHSLERIPEYPYTVDSDSSLSLFGYRLKQSGEQGVVFWLDGEIPTNSNKTTPMTFDFPAGRFAEPVLVDLRTGEVFEIPASSWEKSETACRFKNLPVCDSPVLIADKRMVRL